MTLANSNVHIRVLKVKRINILKSLYLFQVGSLSFLRELITKTTGSTKIKIVDKERFRNFLNLGEIFTV